MPIEAHSFQEFYGNEINYEPPEVSPQRTDVRREWGALGFEDYSIQTIPKMMSSTSDHVRYKGTMSMCKDELEMTLGMSASK